MYLRFVSDLVDERTGKTTGIFTVAYDLLDAKLLDTHEEAHLRELLKWFKANLKVPSKFARKKNVSHKNTMGISWIKAEGKVLSSRLWELKELLERRDIMIKVLRTERPGYIVYEDDHQIVAEPFNRETPN